MIEKNMSQFLGERPGLKYIFFGGKGGVGKTVLVGAAALHSAQQGKRRCWRPPTQYTASPVCWARMFSAGTPQ